MCADNHHMRNLVTLRIVRLINLVGICQQFVAELETMNGFCFKRTKCASVHLNLISNIACIHQELFSSHRALIVQSAVVKG